jgi:hypothetical protein
VYSLIFDKYMHIILSGNRRHDKKLKNLIHQHDTPKLSDVMPITNKFTNDHYFCSSTQPLSIEAFACCCAYCPGVASAGSADGMIEHTEDIGTENRVLRDCTPHSSREASRS